MPSKRKMSNKWRHKASKTRGVCNKGCDFDVVALLALQSVIAPETGSLNVTVAVWESAFTAMDTMCPV